MFQESNPAADRLRKVAAKKIKGIDDITRARIKEILIEQFDAGSSIDITAEAIISEFPEFAETMPQLHIATRAHLIASTEFGEAYGFANYTDAKKTGRELNMEMEKSWMTMHDDSVSDGCLENHAAGWISIKNRFPSGHLYAPRYPGCRCTVLYRVKEAVD